MDRNKSVFRGLIFVYFSLKLLLSHTQKVSFFNENNTLQLEEGFIFSETWRFILKTGISTGKLLKNLCEETKVLKREAISLTGYEFPKKWILDNFHKKGFPSDKKLAGSVYML